MFDPFPHHPKMTRAEAAIHTAEGHEALDSWLNEHGPNASVDGFCDKFLGEGERSDNARTITSMVAGMSIRRFIAGMRRFSEIMNDKGQAADPVSFGKEYGYGRPGWCEALTKWCQALKEKKFGEAAS